MYQKKLASSPLEISVLLTSICFCLELNDANFENVPGARCGHLGVRCGGTLHVCLEDELVDNIADKELVIKLTLVVFTCSVSI